MTNKKEIIRMVPTVEAVNLVIDALNDIHKSLVIFTGTDALTRKKLRIVINLLEHLLQEIIEEEGNDK